MKKERLTKRLALFTALTLTGAMLAGCGNTDAAESSSDAQTGVTADTQAAAGDASADVVYRTLDEIKESGTINIGVFSDKNPFGYVDENGEYQGYDVYFANRLAEDLGVDVNFVSTEAASRIEYLQYWPGSACRCRSGSWRHPDGWASSRRRSHRGWRLYSRRRL